MTPQESIHDDFERMVSVIYALQRRYPTRWPSWRKVSKELSGTEEEAARYAAIADLPDYGAYFARHRDVHVKLTEEGMEYFAGLEAPALSDSNAPKAVAEAIRRYASKLPRIRLSVEGVIPVAEVGSKKVQAFQVKMDDGHVANGTPVEYRPKDGRAWTSGRVVGQDPDAVCVYVSSGTEVCEQDLPGVLAVDRGFMLNELAKQIETGQRIPARVKPLFSHGRGHGQAIDARDAVEAAARLVELPRPWTRVLWGPPGAGKTFAIARFVAHCVREDPDVRVLLLAPSNLAVDVLVEEVTAVMRNEGLGGMIDKRKVLRYGYACKESVLAMPELLGPAEAEELSKSVGVCSRRVATAEQKRVTEAEIATLRAELLAAQVALRSAVEEHAENATVVATTTTLAYMPDSPLVRGRWDVVAVDECTMVPPAMCYYLGSRPEQMFLLAGDPRQLGPVVEFEHKLEDAELRWMGRDVFEASGISSGEGEERQIRTNHPALIRITEQRRCKPRIWDLVTHLYDGVRCRRQAERNERSTVVEPSRQKPVVLLDTSDLGTAPCLPDKRSWYNESSAELSIELATSIVGDNPDVTVAIIAPFRAQVRRLAGLLREERGIFPRYRQIQVGTVHQFQGSAADVVIFDVVEAEARSGLTRLLQGDTGLRLVDVAISRARDKLIVVANRRWHKARTKREANPLLWDLVVDRSARETIVVLDDHADSDRNAWPYESPAEAVLGEVIRATPGLGRVVPQHRICRADGSLISRADFAVPELKYALYVDGACWHLNRKGWQRDRRLRGELSKLGWTITVFGASEAASASDRCIDCILEQVETLSLGGQLPPRSVNNNSWGKHDAA